MAPAQGFDDRAPVFVISVAAELSGMHPQTLRQYDRIGLVQPQRTAGNTRRYSMRDIGQLRQVQLLSQEGVSLAGIRRILDLSNEARELRARVRELEVTLADQVIDRRGRVFAAGVEGVTSIRSGARPAKRNQVVVWRSLHRG